MRVVSSRNPNNFYEVSAHSCTCPDFVYIQAKIGGKCKHIIKYFLHPEDIFELTPEINVELDEIHEYFKDGKHILDAYDKYGDEKIEELLQQQIIIKVGRTFYLLE